jgi:hypothetical protein
MNVGDVVRHRYYEDYFVGEARVDEVVEPSTAYRQTASDLYEQRNAGRVVVVDDKGQHHFSLDVAELSLEVVS